MNSRQRNLALEAKRLVRGKEIVIDSCLLLLLVVGSIDRNRISSRKGLKQFSTDNFDFLLLMISQAPRLVILSHVIAETHSLIGRSHDRAQLIEFLGRLVCEHLDSRRNSCWASRQPEFLLLGFTDVLLMQAADRQNRVLLTIDFDLYSASVCRHINVVNFNHYIDN